MPGTGPGQNVQNSILLLHHGTSAPGVASLSDKLPRHSLIDLPASLQQMADVWGDNSKHMVAFLHANTGQVKLLIQPEAAAQERKAPPNSSQKLHLAFAPSEIGRSRDGQHFWDLEASAG